MRLPRAWWVVASAAASDWHWRDFFRDPAEEGRNWGGREWIRSPLSWARIREMRRGDIVVAYQAGEGVIGLARLASDGYPEVPGGPYDTFDLAPAPLLLLHEPIPLALIRQIPGARSHFEFLRLHHGTVFRITPEGLEALLRLIRALNPEQAADLDAFLRGYN
ncbi:hypothetical protein [Thermoflexus hugenholtzii]